MLNIDDRFLTEASQDQFWLMCHIAQFMNENAACFPSNKTLCERTGWKISKLNEVKKSCIDAAMLKAETRFINARQSTNEYTIMTDRISVMVNLRGKKGKQIPTATAAPCHAGNTQGAALAAPPHTATATPEVLTSNEVLTNEVRVTTAPNFSSTLNAEEKEKNGSTGPAANPPKWGSVNPDFEIQEMINDELCHERFYRQCRIPIEKFADLINLFALKVKSEQATHNNRKDFRSHFFSWATLEYARLKKQDNGGQKFTFDLNKSISEADEWLDKFNREMAAERAMRGG